jgi:F-box and WD-40 domain protein 7
LQWGPVAKRYKVHETVRRCIFPRSPGSSNSSEIESETGFALDLISCLPKEVRRFLRPEPRRWSRYLVMKISRSGFGLFQLALHIFGKLEAKDLLSISQTCRTWRVLAEDDVLWRIKNRKIGLPDERFLFAGSLSLDGFQRSLWKMNYIRHYRIDLNWRNGTNRAPRVRKLYD